jgi:hypothetical protein
MRPLNRNGHPISWSGQPLIEKEEEEDEKLLSFLKAVRKAIADALNMVSAFDSKGVLL